MLLFSLLVEMTLYLLFCLKKTELNSCFPWQPLSWLASRLQPQNKGSLSGDCWVYLRHCRMSLRQFFSCCLRSPPSALLRACSIIFPRRHTPTQFADSSLVVLFLSAFFTFSALQETPRLNSSNVPRYRGRITAGPSNWGKWLGVVSGWGGKQQKNNVRFIYLIFTWVLDSWHQLAGWGRALFETATLGQVRIQ